jgi:hypothetical protein
MDHDVTFGTRTQGSARMTTSRPTARTRAVLVVLTALASIAAMLVPATGSSAATAPPPVSNITVTERTAHRITISYYVPAAYYSPGGGG